MDPVFHYIAAFSFSLLFATAAIGKLKTRDEFKEILIGYQLIPTALIGTFSVLVPVVELVLSVGLLLEATRMMAALIAALVLLGYGVAIWINIQRGNHSLDCGCQLGHGRQTISIGLVIRNIFLAACIALLLSVPADRDLTAYDGGAIAFGLIIVCLFYITANIQIANVTRFREINS